jgi:hypothetical protein
VDRGTHRQHADLIHLCIWNMKTRPECFMITLLLI